MANVTISGLPAAISAAGTDLFAIVQGGVTKQLTNTLLFTSPTFVTPALGTPASGNLANCLGYSGANLSGTVAVANGGTGATTAPTALTNLGGTATGTALFTAANAGAGRTTLSAAALGANSDITSLSGLTTPLSAAQGGTGLTAVGTAGYVVTSDGTNFYMAPAPGAAGSVSSFSGGTTGLTPSTATTGPITLAGTLNVANGGTGLTSPGTAGYLLSSNGTGYVPLAVVPATNGGTGQSTLAAARGAFGSGVSSRKTANYTAVAGDVLACDTIAVGAFTVTLPASPVAGDAPIKIYDAGTTTTVNGFATNNLTIARNGNTICTLAEDVIVSNKGVTIICEYVNGTWRLYNG